MQPLSGRKTKFKLDPPYEHKRSDGLTNRNNGGTRATDRKAVRTVKTGRVWNAP
jgi:hypothetical protein